MGVPFIGDTFFCALKLVIYITFISWLPGEL